MLVSRGGKPAAVGELWAVSGSPRARVSSSSAVSCWVLAFGSDYDGLELQASSTLSFFLRSWTAGACWSRALPAFGLLPKRWEGKGQLLGLLEGSRRQGSFWASAA